MNWQNLRDNYPKLISYMEEDGYCQVYIAAIKHEIDHILSNTDSKDWTSYSDVYMEYCKNQYSPSFLYKKRKYLGIIEHFDVQGLYPNGKRRNKFVERGNYRLLNQEFQSVIDYYCAVEKERGKKDTTILGESFSAASFFLTIQQSGIDAIGAITEEAVLAVFISPEGDLTRSCSYKKNIASVFKACIPQNPETFNKILAFLPALRNTRKNIQYLQPKEVTRLKQTLEDKEALLSLRDRAIGVLALYTGLRCCDIAGLSMNAIDWANDRIYIIQQKTDIPLELPLSATVGNAIYDYLMSERPETECEYIFLSTHRPYGRLKSGSLRQISNKVMKTASIRQSVGDRRGFHIFRHHLATELLENGVPGPVISRILGQTSPASLDTYLSADLKHLKECALSIERFPLTKEVLFDA